MSGKTKILILEHSPDDIELILEELKINGVNFTAKIVQNEHDYSTAIMQFIPDIILSDFCLPSFDGAEAFKIRKALAPDTPFIFVSGSIGEEQSIEYIRNGVTDYVLKDKLFTLTVKVKRALRETKEKEEKKTTERNLALSESLLARAQQVAQLGSWELDFSDNVLKLSAEGCRIFGFTPDQNRLSFDTWSSLVHPEDLESVLKTIKESQDTLTDTNYEHRIVLKDGSIKHIRSESKFEFDVNKKPVGLYGIMQDVTDKVKAAHQLVMSEHQLSVIYNTVADVIFMLNIEENGRFKFVSVNHTFLKITSLTNAEVIGQYADLILPAPSWKIAESNYQKAIATKSSIQWEEFSEYPAGVKNGLVTITPVLDDHGNCFRLVGSVHDITERKKADDILIETAGELQQALNELEKIMHSSLDVICTIDASGRFVKVSAASAWNWGYEPSELIGRRFIDFVYEEDVEKTKKIDAAILSGLPVTSFENRYRHKAGSIVPMLWSSRWDDNDKTVYCVAKDMTEKKRLERAFEAERQHFYDLFQQAPLSIGVLRGPNHIYEMVNEEYLQLIGKEKIIGKSVREVLPEVVEQGFIEILDDVYKTGNPFIANDVHVRLDKDNNGQFSDAYVNIVYQVYRNHQGNIERIFFFAVDVTQQAVSRQKLEESEKKYRQIVETAQEGIWVIDEHNITTFVNKKMGDILGYSPEEMIGKHHHFFMDQEWQQRASEQIADRRLGMNDSHDFKYISKSGKIVWTNLSTNPVLDDAGIYKGALAMITDITERKNAEADLRKRDHQLVLATNMAKLGYWEFDVVNDLFTFNDQFYKIFGTNAKDAGGYTMSSSRYAELFVHPDDKEMVAKSIKESINSGNAYSNHKTEYRIIYADGESGCVSVSFNIVKDKHGRTIKNFGVNQDITERKKAEEHVVNSEEKRRLIMNAALDAIICMDTKGNITFWNPQSEVIFGWKEEEVMGKRLSEFIIPAHYRSQHEQGMAHYLQTGKGPVLNSLLELSAIKKGGKEFLVELTVMPIRQGNEEFFCAFIRDITERKKAEETIKQSNNRLQLATTSTGMGIWDWDIVNNKLEWDESMYRIYRINNSKSKLLYQDWISRLHNEDVQRVNEEIQMALAGKKNYNTEFRIIFEDKSVRHLKATGIVERDAEGNIFRMIGVNWDITQQKEEEQHLKLLESVIVNANDSIIITEAEPLDEPGPRIVYINEAFTKMTGYSSEEVMGKTPRILQGPKTDRKELMRLRAAMSRWEPCEITIINYKKSGEEFWINLSVSPVADEKGWYTHWISVERDITESKLIEIRLNELNESLQKHARQLAISNEELEQFAYVTSHDLQEPLRMISSFLTQLEKRYADIIDEKGKQYIAFAVDGAKRMRQIILDLLEFSRVGKQDDTPEEVDLNALINDIKILFRKQIEEKKAEIKVGVLPKIHAHVPPMRQIFQNLIGNALKYSSEHKAPEIMITSKELPDHWQFAVSDNGIGIDEEYFDKIFIIFQRLHGKNEYSGTGMGLAVTKKIIENQGGRIWLESEEGKGSTFYFTLLKK